MIIIPREKPVIENLNSYYLDIRKLLEHYQGELGSGGIHFKAPNMEGVLFFDKDEFLNGIFSEKGREIEGKEALDRIVDAVTDNNFTINIYKIDPERIYFWANLSSSEDIYRDLSTEFTDLEGLIKKMSSEKLTGYIDVSIGKNDEGGLLFFNNGEIMGGSYSWGKGELDGSKENQDLLISKSKKSGGVCNVRKIPVKIEKGEEKSETDKVVETAPEISFGVLTLLEEMMVVFEKLMQSDKKIRTEFDTLLRKKFVEKADDYPFLDPFTSEFAYSNQKVTFVGDTSYEIVARGVVECVKELADEFEMLKGLTDALTPWSNKYSKDLVKFGISF